MKQKEGMLFYPPNLSRKCRMKTLPRWLTPVFILAIVSIAIVAIQNFGQKSLIYASGTIFLDESLIPQAKGIRTVFITLFDSENTTGMPYGAIKYVLGSDSETEVLEFTLTRDNLRVMNEHASIPKSMRIKARLDRTGQAGPDKPGDLIGELNPITLGANDVKLVINRVVQ